HPSPPPFPTRRSSDLGVGTTPHLSGELFNLSARLDLVHVPFNGAGPAIQSTVAGHTPIMFTTLAPAIPLIKDGKLRALAVMAKRSEEHTSELQSRGHL